MTPTTRFSPRLELALGLAGIALAAAVAAGYLLPEEVLFPGRVLRRNEASAIRSLRTIITAEEQYHSGNTYGTLRALSGMTPPFIDADLGLGRKDGYRFRLEETYSGGAIEEYRVWADPEEPGRTGARHFFVNELGEIRQRFGAPASSRDPPVGGND